MEHVIDTHWEACFSPRMIGPHTWMIDVYDAKMGITVQCYLLEGDEFAVAIDSGCCEGNLYTFMQTLTQLPIRGVINTHAHFDHTKGNRNFPHAWFHAEAITPRPQEGLPEGIALQCFDENGNCVWNEFDNGIHDAIQATVVQDGFTLELGNRLLTFIEIGAHDAASLAILDPAERFLFCGDEIETGWCNVGTMRKPMAASATIETHLRNMLKLKARFNEFDRLCPGHHGGPIAKESLNHQITLDRMILDGNVGSADIPECVLMGTQGSDARILCYRSAKRCFSVNRIWDGQGKA